MILQSDETSITLLPALPETWKNGEIRDFRTRCGVRVSMRFTDGVVADLTLSAELVTSRDKIVGDVKFARHMADLTVSHEAIVQEEIKAGVNTLKVEVKAFIFDAVFRYIKFADVKSAGFLVGTNGGSKVMG